MSFTKHSFPILSISIIFISLHIADGASFEITSRCDYTVWAAAEPGGGSRLDPGQVWVISANTTPGRIWGRTNCVFGSTGGGRCETGDCGGVLPCRGKGSPPTTLAEFALNQTGNYDFFDISLVDGFNIPIELAPDPPCAAAEYCCTGTNNCGPTNYSRFFKDRCPDAYSYPRDDATSTFTCPSGTNYRVTFCPLEDDKVPPKFVYEMYCSL